MATPEIEKSETHILIEITQYMPNSVAAKNIIRKPPGTKDIIAIDSGEVLAEKNSPFDSFIQIIDGTAEIIIDKKSNILKTGE